MAWIFSKLFNESFIRINLNKYKVYLCSSSLNQPNHMSQGIPVFPEQVGNHNSYTSAHPHHAMHQHISSFTGIINKFKSLLEIVLQLELGMVISRYVHVLVYVFGAVGNYSASGTWKYSPNIFAYFEIIVLWRREMSSAAARLEIKMDPQPVKL